MKHIIITVKHWTGARAKCVIKYTITDIESKTYICTDSQRNILKTSNYSCDYDLKVSKIVISECGFTTVYGRFLSNAVLDKEHVIDASVEDIQFNI